MALVQRINLSHKTFGDYRLGNAAASNDGSGHPGGSFVINGQGVADTPIAVSKLTLKEDGTAVVELGPQHSVSAKGEYNKDASTERILNPEITAMKINGNEVVPSKV